MSSRGKKILELLSKNDTNKIKNNNVHNLTFKSSELLCNANNDNNGTALQESDAFLKGDNKNLTIKDNLKSISSNTNNDGIFFTPITDVMIMPCPEELIVTLPELKINTEVAATTDETSVLVENYVATGDGNLIFETCSTSTEGNGLTECYSTVLNEENKKNGDITTVETNNLVEMDASSDYSSDDNIPLRELQLRVNEIKETKQSTKRKRCIRGRSNPAVWKKNESIRKRRLGEEYVGRKVVGREEHPVLKQPRTLGLACSSQQCQKSKIRHCTEFSDEIRVAIFNSFWKDLDWGQRKIYVSALIDVVPVNRRRVPACVASRRLTTLKYNLKKNNAKLSVCKAMFLSTLGIGEWTARAWAKTSEIGTHKSALNKSIEKKCPKQEETDRLKLFLTNLPKLPSHYCRSGTSKLYLEPLYNSKVDVYNLYCSYCKDLERTPLSLATFKTIFTDMNIALFQPKKDQCDLCVMHEVGNLSDVDWNAHQKKKDAARTEMEVDTKKAMLDKSCIVLTMDLQSVLLSPRLKASALYYKTKLIVHNFTIYDNVSHAVKCYVWHECEGGVTADEFASCVVNYLETTCSSEGVNKVIIWSDGCTYQNRNATMSNALIQCASQMKITIIQKILEKGHTQMCCDSVHSVIERKLKDKVINVPADYVSIIRSARKKPEPYHVQYLNYDFFKHYSSLKAYISIRPGKKPGDAVVTDLRSLKYSPDGTIEYKLQLSNNWSLLPIRHGEVLLEKPPQLYQERLKVTLNKYKDLQELKKVLQVDYHSFYNELPYDNK